MVTMVAINSTPVTATAITPQKEARTLEKVKAECPDTAVLAKSAESTNEKSQQKAGIRQPKAPVDEAGLVQTTQQLCGLLNGPQIQTAVTGDKLRDTKTEGEARTISTPAAQGSKRDSEGAQADLGSIPAKGRADGDTKGSGFDIEKMAKSWGSRLGEVGIALTEAAKNSSEASVGISNAMIKVGRELQKKSGDSSVEARKQALAGTITAASVTGTMAVAGAGGSIMGSRKAISSTKLNLQPAQTAKIQADKLTNAAGDANVLKKNGDNALGISQSQFRAHDIALQKSNMLTTGGQALTGTAAIAGSVGSADFGIAEAENKADSQIEAADSQVFTETSKAAEKNADVARTLAKSLNDIITKNSQKVDAGSFFPA